MPKVISIIMTYDLFRREKSEGLEYKKAFILWPKRWNSFQWGNSLDWRYIQAKKENIILLPDSSGVYVFVIEPIVAELPVNGIVAYVGETTGQTQSLQTRCARYFQPSEHEKRPHIGELIRLWPENLFLYYVELPTNKVKMLESELLKALLPPFNRRFHGSFTKLALSIYGP